MTTTHSATKRYRSEALEAEPTLKQLLQRTAGSWREGDGLAYQRAIRGEWEGHSEESAH